jgi:hypothetical protein
MAGSDQLKLRKRRHSSGGGRRPLGRVTIPRLARDLIAKSPCLLMNLLGVFGKTAAPAIGRMIVKKITPGRPFGRPGLPSISQPFAWSMKRGNVGRDPNTGPSFCTSVSSLATRPAFDISTSNGQLSAVCAWGEQGLLPLHHFTRRQATASNGTKLARLSGYCRLPQNDWSHHRLGVPPPAFRPCGTARRAQLGALRLTYSPRKPGKMLPLRFVGGTRSPPAFVRGLSKISVADDIGRRESL